MMRPTLSDLLRAVHVARYDETFIARVVKNLGGGRPPFVFSTSVPASLGLHDTENVVLTSPPLNPGVDNTTVLLLGFWNMSNTGSASTLITSQFRRGTTVAGTQVGPIYTTTVANAQALGVALVATDTPGIVAGQQYVLTGISAGNGSGALISTGLIVSIALG